MIALSILCQNTPRVIIHHAPVLPSFRILLYNLQSNNHHNSPFSKIASNRANKNVFCNTTSPTFANAEEAVMINVASKILKNNLLIFSVSTPSPLLQYTLASKTKLLQETPRNAQSFSEHSQPSPPSQLHLLLSTSDISALNS
jgi:hypothetical protein